MTSKHYKLASKVCLASPFLYTMLRNNLFMLWDMHFSQKILTLFFLSSPKFPQAAELDDAQLSITGNQLLITSHK